MKQIVIFLFTFAYIFSDCFIVKVEEGEIAGKAFTSATGRTYHAFLGVPYAAPPIGELRFREPQRLKPWTGIWNATNIPRDCLQYSHTLYDISGDEDCLYLFVFSSKLPKNRINPLLDVLVFFHAGAFMYGSGSALNPENLFHENKIVVVFVHYRLGSLGFFSTGDRIVPGNNGLKDQVAALQWIQRNIIHFGGNPDSITISGCSAGGASVHYHFLSPLSEGLFQKGISFSGSVLLPWSLSEKNTEKCAHLATFLGCPSNDSLEMVNCLRRRPAKHIVEAGKYFQPWHYSPFTPFGPVIEPANPDAFLDENPLRLLSAGKFKKLPWLVTFNKDEGLYPAADFINNDTALRELDENWNEIAPHLFFYNFSTNSEVEKADISVAIRKFYLGDEPVSKRNAFKLVEALGHRIFFVDMIHAVKLHAFASSKEVFCYMFNYRGKYSISTFFSKSYINYGTSHGDDIIYLFFGSDLFAEEANDFAVASFLSSAITRFMRTGNPTPNNVEWKPTSKNLNDHLHCLHINSSKIQFMDHVSYEQASEFWKRILPSEYLNDLPAREELK